MPRVEVGPEPLDGVTAEQTAVPALEAVELVPIAGVQHPELAADRRGSEQSLLELVERPLERLDEPRVRRGTGVAMEIGRAHHPAHEQRALRAPQRPPNVARAEGDTLEHVVEGADRAAEQRVTPPEQLALDAVDVRPVRHDEYRFGPLGDVERSQITVEQELDLARVGGPHDQAERHPPTLARVRDGL